MSVIKEIKDAKVWDDFLLSQPTQAGIFLQSWQWLSFQESLGNKAWRLGVEKGNRLVGVCGLVKNMLPFSRGYLYSPRGPLFIHNFSAFDYRDVFETVRDYIKKMAPSERALFWCFEPMANLAPLPRLTGGYGAGNPIEATSLHTHRGRYLISHARPTASRQPKQTLIIDLSLEESVLCSRMHEKTRYNMRLAARKGVVVKNFQFSILNFQLFFKLLQETAKRDKFKIHAEEYYKKMLEIGNYGQMSARLWLAYVGEEVAAGAIVAYFGDTATYLHGASSYVHRNLMAPNLLHWEIMKAAKKEGYKKYDFWGIDEKKWPGLTRFKRGFGGHEVYYPGTFDLPIKKFWYKLYWLGRKFV